MKPSRLLSIAACFVVLLSTTSGTTRRTNSNGEARGKTASLSQGPLTPTCNTPSLPQPAPSTALDIDAQCGLAGSGGAEAAQNSAKNNFCASGEAKTITIFDLKKLQTTVENDNSINFGNRNQWLSANKSAIRQKILSVPVAKAKTAR